MKKKLIIILAIVLILAALIVLTVCWKNKKDPSNIENSSKNVSSDSSVLIATKTTEEDFGEGNDSTITFVTNFTLKFNADILDSVSATFTFENANIAKAYAEDYNSMIDSLADYAEEGEELFDFPKLSFDGNVATMNLDKETFLEMFLRPDANWTMNSIKIYLEASGYEVTVK